MLVQTRHFSMPATGVVLLAVLALTGCCQQCASNCTPNGPWQSPTIQATRSLMLVNTEELTILSIDGKKVPPSCIGPGEVREYHLRPGEHTLLVRFRYAAPASAGMLADVHGEPVTLRHEFQVGHEYVAIYREYPYPKPEGDASVADVVTNISGAEELYWSLAMTDLTDAEAQVEPEVTEAQIYCTMVRGPDGPLAQAAEPSESY